jgi:hypothetical protein
MVVDCKTGCGIKNETEKDKNEEKDRQSPSGANVSIGIDKEFQ